jgi:uncharacterized membrane protein
MLDTVLGLPVHPLVVHLTVVAVPVACLLVLLCAVWRHARERWGWATVLLCLLATASVAVAALSGGPLARRLPPSHTIAVHAELAKVMALLVSAMTVAVTTLVYLAWRSAGAPVASWIRLPAGLHGLLTPGPLGRLATIRGVVPIVAASALLLALGTAVDIVAVGHLGATAAWSKTAEQAHQSR